MSDESFPSGWASVPIEECLLPYPNGRRIRQGWSPQCESHPAETLAHWGVLRTSAIQDGVFLDHENKHLPSSLEPRKQLEVEAGDILITCAGPRSRCGVTCLVRKTRPRLLISGKMYQLRCDPEVCLAELLELFLRESRTCKRIDEMKTGISDSGLNLTHARFSTLEVPLPPLNEQKRIVAKIEELFSELDAGEESLRKARRQLGVYRQSLLKQAFEGKLTAAWREQNPELLGKPLAATTKLDAEPGPLPPGWIWQTICEVANVSGGLTKNSKRDSLPLRIPYLRVANVYANELRLAEIKDIGVTPAEAAKVRLVKGDLLIVEGNGSLDQIGRVAAWNGSISDCGHQNHLIRARCQPNAHYAFVLMFLLSPHGRDVIEKQAASTSGLHTLSVSKVQRLPVPLCSLPEQQEIVRLLDEQFTVIEQNEREIDTALKRSEALRQAILKKAFSGQLVAQDPADEPAGALLERIRKERKGKRSDGSGRSAGSDRSLPDPAPEIGEDLFRGIAAGKPRKPNPAGTPGKTDLQAGLVALAIAAHENGSEHLGHVKAEKIVHLCDVIARLQLDRHPVKDAAGPNDFPQAKKVEHRAKMQGWFTVKQKPGAKAYTYQRGRNFDRLVHDTEARLGPQLQTLRDLIGDLAAMSWQEAELVATVHAAWNNLLLAGESQPTEEAIVREARENWHPDKLKIRRERFFEAIAWIEGAEVVPTGAGAVVPAKRPGAGRS